MCISCFVVPSAVSLARVTVFSLAGTMWASCCNWFCMDGSPEEMQPPPAARAQAYSNPGYSSFPSPTASEQSCKACGMHFDSSSSKVSARPCLHFLTDTRYTHLSLDLGMFRMGEDSSPCFCSGILSQLTGIINGAGNPSAEESQTAENHLKEHYHEHELLNFLFKNTNVL